MLEFLSGLDSTMMIFVVIAFIVFIFLIRKIFSIMINLVIVAVVSAIFPFVMNRFLDFSLPTDLTSLMSFVLLGVIIYLIYLLATVVYKTLGIFEKIIGKFTSGRQRRREIDEAIEKKMEKNKPKKWHKEMKSQKKIKPMNEKEYFVLKDKKRKKD